MTATQDYSTLFKDVYGNGPVNLLPSADKCQKMFPFAKGQMVGNQFVENLDLEFEHGFTFGGNQVAPTLNGGIASENQKAQITPSQIIGQKIVGYRDITRTDGAGKKAFTSVVHKRIIDLMRGTRRTIEISIMHGQSTDGIGVVAGAVSGKTITLTAATTAPGIWAGARNMKVDVYQSDGTTLRQGGLNVVSVNPSNLDAFTVTFASTDTVTGINTNDIVYRYNANVSGTFGECVGIKTILKNTGTLFNIDASLHNLWQANSYSVSGRLTIRDILAAVDLGVAKGLEEDVVALIPTRAFSRLNDDFNSMLMKDESYDSKKGEAGVEGITLHGQTGKITIVPHIYMMQGEAWTLPYDGNGETSAEDKPVKRIGSTDVTFGLPGAQGGTASDDIFVQGATTASVEIRNFTDQAPFISKPGHCTYMSGITYP